MSMLADLRSYFGSTRRKLLALFWVWYGVTAAIYIFSDFRLATLGPVSPSLVWLLVLRFREGLQGLARRLPFPAVVKYFVFGLFFADVVVENIAISFQGDLHPNLFLNSLLWIGAYAGVLLGWWLVAHFYPFSAWQVFFLYGLKGVVVEQDWMVPLMVARGEILQGLLVAPLLIVVYGTCVAPAFVALEKELPKPSRKLNWAGVVLGLVIPAALFYGGAYVWFKLVEVLLGLKA